MPPAVPEEFTNPEDARIWRDIARLFEDSHPELGYEPENPAGAFRRRQHFLAILDNIRGDLMGRSEPCQQDRPK